MNYVRLLFFAGVGGFIGTVLRYGLNIILTKYYSSDFPWATFIVNIFGSFLLGSITELANKYVIIKPEYYVLLTIGICGGFTTFSTLMYESYHLLKDEILFKTILYGALSYMTGFLFFYSGILLIRFLFSKMG